jgi:MerR family transcriptional regulator, heat shock protein HspR
VTSRRDRRARSWGWPEVRGAERQREVGQSARRAVYMIGVAAELAGVHPQTLRIYERKGLVQPERTSGNTRRYSQEDIERLQAIQQLTDEGVNLAGVKRIMELRAEIEAMHAHIEELQEQVERRRAIAMPGRRVTGALVPTRAIIRLPWEPR